MKGKDELPLKNVLTTGVKILEVLPLFSRGAVRTEGYIPAFIRGISRPSSGVIALLSTKHCKLILGRPRVKPNSSPVHLYNTARKQAV